MTALEKLAINLKPTDEYVADEFFNTFRKKCPDEVFPGTTELCEEGCYDGSFRMCVQCWLQEVTDGSKE